MLQFNFKCVCSEEVTPTRTTDVAKEDSAIKVAGH